MSRLIVNADDFGYTSGVNRAIFELHRAGAISSATLMATGAALEDALARLPRQAGRLTPSGELGVGCHVVLVDGAPVLPAKELPTLAWQLNSSTVGGISLSGPSTVPSPRDRACFRPTLSSFITDLTRGRIREAEIELEAVAQIRLLQRRGILITHLDTHKHTHMFPRVLRPLLRAALRCGVKAIRNPFEPAWSLRVTPGAPLVRRAEVRLLSLLRPAFARLVAQAGLRTTGGAIGVLATGTLDGPVLERLLDTAIRGAENASRQGDTIWELVCHPGYHDAALAAQSTRLLAERERERAALLEALPTLRNFTLIHFGELSG
jgi:predicted glycoside hydrolase/deacetylase ChbG (UPF0249 family)